MIAYKRITCARTLVAHSGAGFRKGEKEGHGLGRAVRGAYFMRLGTRSQSGHTGDFPCHLLDWACDSRNIATRSNFTRETQVAVMTTDHALLLGPTLYEIAQGPVTPQQGMDLRDRRGFCFGISLGVDAMSLVSALSVAQVQATAEKSMLSHLLWRRELLDNGFLAELSWLDTRDMSADGHTKGSVSR